MILSHQIAKRSISSTETLLQCNQSVVGFYYGSSILKNNFCVKSNGSKNKKEIKSKAEKEKSFQQGIKDALKKRELLLKNDPNTKEEKKPIKGKVEKKEKDLEKGKHNEISEKKAKPNYKNEKEKEKETKLKKLTQEETKIPIRNVKKEGKIPTKKIKAEREELIIPIRKTKKKETKSTDKIKGREEGETEEIEIPIRKEKKIIKKKNVENLQEEREKEIEIPIRKPKKETVKIKKDEKEIEIPILKTMKENIKIIEEKEIDEEEEEKEKVDESDEDEFYIPPNIKKTKKEKKKAAKPEIITSPKLNIDQLLQQYKEPEIQIESKPETLMANPPYFTSNLDKKDEYKTIPFPEKEAIYQLQEKIMPDIKASETPEIHPFNDFFYFDGSGMTQTLEEYQQDTQETDDLMLCQLHDISNPYNDFSSHTMSPEMFDDDYLVENIPQDFRSTIDIVLPFLKQLANNPVQEKEINNDRDDEQIYPDFEFPPNWKPAKILSLEEARNDALGLPHQFYVLDPKRTLSLNGLPSGIEEDEVANYIENYVLKDQKIIVHVTHVEKFTDYLTSERTHCFVELESEEQVKLIQKYYSLYGLYVAGHRCGITDPDERDELYVDLKRKHYDSDRLMSNGEITRILEEIGARGIAEIFIVTDDNKYGMTGRIKITFLNFLSAYTTYKYWITSNICTNSLLRFGWLADETSLPSLLVKDAPEIVEPGTENATQKITEESLDEPHLHQNYIGLNLFYVKQYKIIIFYLWEHEYDSKAAAKDMGFPHEQLLSMISHLHLEGFDFDIPYHYRDQYRLPIGHAINFVLDPDTKKYVATPSSNPELQKQLIEKRDEVKIFEPASMPITGTGKRYIPKDVLEEDFEEYEEEEKHDLERIPELDTSLKASDLDEPVKETKAPKQVLKYGNRKPKKQPTPPKKPEPVLEEDFELYDQGELENSANPSIDIASKPTDLDEQIRYQKLQNINTEEKNKRYLYEEIAHMYENENNNGKKNENRS